MAGTVRYGFALSAGTVAVLLVDLLGTSDDAGPVVLLVLLVAAFVLGGLVPPRAWLTGLVIGVTPAAATTVLVLVAPDRVHHLKPAGLAGAASLLALVLPAVVAAFAGAALRRSATRPAARPRR